MAPIITSLKNFIHRGHKKQKSNSSNLTSSPTTSVSTSTATATVAAPSSPFPPSTMQTRDSGTALDSASNSPPASHRIKDHASINSLSSHFSPRSIPKDKAVSAMSRSRSASPHRAAAAGVDLNPCGKEIHNRHREVDATSSAQHFATSDAHRQHNNNNNNNSHHHHVPTNNNNNTNGHRSNSYGGATFGHNNNTEAASRMVAEANQQKSMLPVYPGLDRYTLLEKMGDGAFSNVFKAHDTKTDRVVAIKVVRKYDMNAHQNKHLHRDMKKKPRVTERANILKEVQIMRQLKHPGIVELYDFSESNDYYYLILELATGGELFHRIVKLTYFSEDLARHVIVQVAQAIRYLHEEKGVIHRDIKPENILFEPIPIIPSPPGYKPDDEDKEDEGIFQPGIGGGGIGRVKIADFGLSKVVWNEQTMTPCGTVGYTAPEIVKDERYSKSVDMWALGCVLYTLLVGFPPFYDESIQALTEKVARGQFTFLSPWWDDISIEVKDLISHLLCVNPNERYTIDQFLAHPWIQAGAPGIAGDVQVHASSAPAFAENKILAGVAAMTPNYGIPGTPKTPYRRRAENPLSPGIGLREVFDVSNAVHRMGEESRRRHTPQPAGHQAADARQRQAFMSQLNEEDEEGEVSDESGSNSAMSEDEAIAVGMGDVRIHALDDVKHRQQQEYQRAQEQIAAEKHRKYLRQQQQAGQAIPSHHISSSASRHQQHHHHPQTSSTSSSSSAAYAPSGRSSHTTSSSVSTVSSSASSASRRRRAGFDLNMNQATLLKRRAKQANQATPQQQLHHHHYPAVDCQDQMMRQQLPAVAV